MRKTIISLFFLGASFLGSAQDLKGFHIGASVMPFHYWYINKSFNENNGLKSNNNLLNGFLGGFSIEYFINNHLGFKKGLSYSYQKQEYLIGRSVSINNNIAYYFDLNNYKTKTRISYFQIPIIIEMVFPISDNLYITTEQGTQFSFLSKYEYTLQIPDDKDRIKSIYTNTNSYIQLIDYINPSNNYRKEQNSELYNKILFGYVGKIGTKYMFTDKLFLSGNLIFNYDFSNADDNTVNLLIDGNKTHNIRAGIELGVSYKLEKRCSCSK